MDQVACAKGWDGRKHSGLRAWRPAHTRPRDSAPEPDSRWGSRKARERFKIRGGKVSLAFQEVWLGLEKELNWGVGKHERTPWGLRPHGW